MTLRHGQGHRQEHGHIQCHAEVYRHAKFECHSLNTARDMAIVVRVEHLSSLFVCFIA